MGARTRASACSVVEAVERTNEAQKAVLVPRIEAHLGGLEGKRIAVWGLAFKPRTDDMREAPALAVIEELLQGGAKVAAYDPKADDERAPALRRPRDVLRAQPTRRSRAPTRWSWSRSGTSSASPIRDASSSLMRRPAIFDGRNIYDPRLLRELGFHYEGIGRR